MINIISIPCFPAAGIFTKLTLSFVKNVKNTSLTRNTENFSFIAPVSKNNNQIAV